MSLIRSAPEDFTEDNPFVKEILKQGIEIG